MLVDLEADHENTVFAQITEDDNNLDEIADARSAAPSGGLSRTNATNSFTDSHAADTASFFGDGVSTISLDVYHSSETQDSVVVLRTETPGQEPSIAVLPFTSGADVPAASEG
ncbi:hypothetical protein FA95DRAFT_1604850 [Auriscalpium vulgare]|uniref:Uncharacterized protein n=1 Tax=Auriscalpium vulgare TaxID=40419 RepID=A0ACB8RZB0_9AGAM|nr:hypothetical protein FA95DRAFT_1604850 [Auriscalpium vulgare]